MMRKSQMKNTDFGTGRVECRSLCQQSSQEECHFLQQQNYSLCDAIASPAILSIGSELQETNVMHYPSFILLQKLHGTWLHVQLYDSANKTSNFTSFIIFFLIKFPYNSPFIYIKMLQTILVGWIDGGCGGGGGGT